MIQGRVRTPHSVATVAISEVDQLSLEADFFRLVDSDFTGDPDTGSSRGRQRRKAYLRVIFPKCQNIYSKHSRSRETSLVMKYVEQNKVGYVLV